MNFIYSSYTKISSTHSIGVTAESLRPEGASASVVGLLSGFVVVVQEGNNESRNALRLSSLAAEQALPLERLAPSLGQVSLAAAGRLGQLGLVSLENQAGRAVGVEQGPE
jgi:hypothetical protein